MGRYRSKKGVHTRICEVCHTRKSTDSFDGYSHECKQCHSDGLALGLQLIAEGVQGLIAEGYAPNEIAQLIITGRNPR